MRWAAMICVLSAAGLIGWQPAAHGANDSTDSTPPPKDLTADQDHRLMMELLDVKSLRGGANGNDSNAPNAANYDEAKANPYPCLPDPLLTNGRQRVDTADLWWKARRPEIVELFDREVYGRVPADVPKVTWEVTGAEEGKTGDVATVTKKLTGHVDNSAYPAISVDIEANLTTPKEAKGPVPVIVQFSGGFFFSGGRPGQFPGRPGGARPGGPPPGFQPPPGPNWRELVIAKGWGYAAINTSSIQDDNGAGLTKGIVGLVNKGQPRKADDWGSLRAWAWGVSRLLDYFETDPAVDAKRVGLEGHSRWGKATLVAMAYDPRFAAAYVSSSGEGGAKLNRRNCGEIIENLTGTGEYHWMAGNFLKYGGPLTWDDLPVDAHELIAMCAPRPVFISSGQVGDAWVDARGMFMAAAAAQPVYALLGAKTMGTDDFPEVEHGLMDGEIAFRQHSAGHTDQPNWPTFLEFAGRYFDRPAL